MPRQRSSSTRLAVGFAVFILFGAVALRLPAAAETLGTIALWRGLGGPDAPLQADEVVLLAGPAADVQRLQ